jgi:predicted short-subunit dehydrogenase-like oxidoreductase (DUF2520 family)
MRELDRHPQPSPAPVSTALERPELTAVVRPEPTALERVAIVGNGRLGNVLARALRAGGTQVTGPLLRDEAPGEVAAVLLCVPDAEIAAAAAAMPPGLALGHCSGATGLDVLASRARDCFSLHPLMTVTAEAEATAFAGAGAAVAGSSPAMLALARALAHRLGMHPIEVSPEDRTAYHAAASIASNFLVTLEAAAERLAGAVGVERADLLPLVRATVENWARLGGERALTGPVARGDDRTVAAQRQAIAERAPDLLALFDTLVDATRALATADVLVR